MQEYTTIKSLRKHCQDILDKLQEILDILGENKLTINFDVSEKGIAPEPFVVYKDQTYGLLPEPISSQSSEGYDFQGWFFNRWRNSNGEYEYSDEITNLMTVTMSGSIILYAKWQPSWIEVRLNPNGGSVNPERIYVQYLSKFGTAIQGEDYPDKGLPIPVDPDKSFNSWQGIIANTGILQRVDNNSILNTANPSELSVVWESKRYTLDFDVQNAAGGIESITNIINGTLVQLPSWSDISGFVENPGYKFLGWSRTRLTRDMVDVIDNVQKIEIVRNTTVYAIWTNEKYTIKYYDLNGEFAGEQSTVLNVPDYLIPISQLKGNFKGFNHWNSIPETYADWCKFTDGAVIYNLTEVPDTVVPLYASKDRITGKVVSMNYDGQCKRYYYENEPISIEGLTFVATFYDEGSYYFKDVTNSVKIYPTRTKIGLADFYVSFRYYNSSVNMRLYIDVSDSLVGMYGGNGNAGLGTYTPPVDLPFPDDNPDPDPDDSPTPIDDPFVLPPDPDQDPVTTPSVSIVKSIVINPLTLTMNRGESRTLSAIETLKPGMTIVENVSWRSSDINIATVSKGNVYAKAAGSVTLTATSSDGCLTASCALTVVISATSIAISKKSVSLYVGNSHTFTVTVSPSNTTNKTITWTTLNSNVATVSNGKVTAKAIGTTAVTARTSNGLTASATITVVSGNSSSGTTYRKAPTPGGTTQFWYGRVNYWINNTSILATEIKKMSELGLKGYIIEFAGCGRESLRQPKGSSQYSVFIQSCKNGYQLIHKLCKDYGIWLFVSIVNDNALANSHGNIPVNPSHYYNDVARDLLAIIIADGPENVIVQPVAELYENRVSNSPGPSFQRYAISQLSSKKFITCNNDEYGTPVGYSSCNYRAWHPQSISEKPSGNKSKTFLISDTGNIIEQLNGGTDVDTVDANCSPSRVREWRNSCIGYAVCGYYDYKRLSYNEAAIRAMANK